MKRIAIALTVVALLAGAAMAQCPATSATEKPMQGKMKMMKGKMMPPPGTAALAVHEGSIYVIDGDMLKKLTADMSLVKAVDLDLECPMQGKNQHMGMMGQKARPGCPMASEPHAPKMEGKPGCPMASGPRGAKMKGKKGPGMQMGGRGGGLQLAADSSGVYVLHHGTLTRYDHDLNETASKEIMTRPKMMGEGPGQGMGKGCPMHGMKDMKDDGACGVCGARGMLHKRPGKAMDRPGMHGGQGRHMGGMMQGRGGQHAPVGARRSIDNGEVTLGYLPADLDTGQVDLRVHVMELSGDYDADADVSAYLYPEDNVESGKTIALQSHRDGRFMAETTIPTMGTWELAVRVSRPGVEDVTVYFPMQVSH